MNHKYFLTVLLATTLAGQVRAQQTIVPSSKPIEIRVAPATTAGPSVSITPGSRHGHGTPHRLGCSHTGGGNIDVAQPSPDTLVLTMGGVAVATSSLCCPGSASMDFDLTQEFEVVFEKRDVKAAKITVEARAIGLLRSNANGMAELSHGEVSICSATNEVLALSLPDHSVAGGDNLSINDHEGPVVASVGAGKYRLCQTVHFLASHPKAILPCKASSAEFAPDPALDPLWISYWEPFHGVAKKDFGFQVTIKVAADNESPTAEPKKASLPELRQVPVTTKR